MSWKSSSTYYVTRRNINMNWFEEKYVEKFILVNILSAYALNYTMLNLYCVS